MKTDFFIKHGCLNEEVLPQSKALSKLLQEMSGADQTPQTSKEGYVRTSYVKSNYVKSNYVRAGC